MLLKKTVALIFIFLILPGFSCEEKAASVLMVPISKCEGVSPENFQNSSFEKLKLLALGASKDCKASRFSIVNQGFFEKSKAFEFSIKMIENRNSCKFEVAVEFDRRFPEGREKILEEFKEILPAILKKNQVEIEGNVSAGPVLEKYKDIVDWCNYVVLPK